MDIAGKDYWDERWNKYSYKPLNSKSYINKRLIELFSRYIGKGNKAIEIGCANSQWLPFLKTHFGIEITGIDYSDKGIETLKIVLSKNEIKGDLYCCDFMSYPIELRESYDILISLGVIEHFTNYSEVLQHFSQFLKNGGIIITVIPNFASPFYGYIQKKISRAIFEKHVIIDKELLIQAHKDFYKVIFCDYFGAFEPSLFDYNDKKGVWHLLFDFLIGFATKLVAPLLNRFHIADQNKLLSNYIISIGRKL